MSLESSWAARTSARRKLFEEMWTSVSGHTSGRSGLQALVLRSIPVLLLLSSLARSQAVNSPSPLQTLRTIRDVFALSKDEAARAYPVELDAVVTYSDPEWGMLFVQDATGVTYIGVHGNISKFPLGAHVRVSAVTITGAHGAAIGPAKILVLGQGTLPAPEHRGIAELDAGEGESHRAVTEGILHPCERDWNRVCFRIRDGEKAIWLMVHAQESPASRSLIGATVRVEGMVGRQEDDEHHRLGAQLLAESLDDIKVETPPPPVSFSSPATPIQNLRDADADRRFAPQVHVRGTVTWRSPELFTVQDDTGMIFVGTGKGVEVRTGNSVDVVGFPSHGALGLELADSIVQPVSGQADATAIAPLELTAAEVLKRGLNGRRVHLRARLISQSARPNEFIYLLESGGQRFNAVLPRNEAAHETVGFSRDAVIDLTGVALIQSQRPEWPESLLILIESPTDMVVLAAPSWLSLKSVLIILGLMAVGVIAPLIWVKALRRTVRQQTAIIRTRLESEMRLETKYGRLVERNLAAVFSWQPDGSIVDCNLAFARMLGFDSREKLIGRSCRSFQIDSASQEPVCGVLSDEPVSNREVSLRRDDGSVVHLMMNITPVKTSDGTLYETTAIDVTQLRENQAELQRARDAAIFESLNDPLTGLPNRKLLMDTLSSLLAVGHQGTGKIAVLYIDLDGFKLVNDSLGHAVGDALLVQVASRMLAWMREGDMLARLGGDEFMVIMRAIHAREDATMLAEYLLDDISSSFEVKGHLLAIGASIGISIYPEDATDAEELIQQSDSAMYVGKREGKNHVTFYTPEIGSQVHERLTLEHLLRGAVARGEISVHYQPEFELVGHRLTRFEALARWAHPTLGQIPPLKFIPIAEESGMIWALGAYIMECACTEAVRWQKLMPYPIQVGVNVSAVQFRRKGFVEEVTSILQRTGLRPELLQIEVTESVMIGGTYNVAETIDRLRELGISMAIDDFGTGYSNMSYLPTLAFDYLKIDRSFVSNLGKRPETESMMRTLIGLAHNFGMQVIVEGAESQEQLNLVRTLGANEVQGFFTGRPTPNPGIYLLLPASL